MKLIHTADIRLDRCYAEESLPPDAGRANREHLRQRLQAILERAVSWQADAVLIAGNLLDLDTVERETIGFLREAFERVAPIPILIAPGPLDPYTATSPYTTELWPENVRIFRGGEWESFEISGLTVYGYGYADREIALNPFDQFETLDSESLHVVMGSVDVGQSVAGEPGGEGGVSVPQLTGRGLAYVALGGLPETSPVGENDTIPAWYSGAPEGGSFSEPGPHHYLEVTIEVANDVPRTTVAQVPISQGRFFEMRLDCTDLDSGQALIDAIRPNLLNAPDRQCVRIVLEGALLPSIYGEMPSIQDVLSEELLHLDLLDRCFLAENFEALAEERTSLGAFVSRISDEIGDAPDSVRQAALCRSRDLALCAYRGQHLPIRSSLGD